MDWKKKCFAALNAENMFETSGHSTRFRELVDCFSGYPFFTKGVCKCVYLSAWDEEHFCILLEMLTDLSLGKETTTREMSIRGDALAEEQTSDEYYVYLLSLAFINNTPYTVTANSSIRPETRHIIQRALHASEIIDRL